MRVAVTGGAGFIGTHVCEELANQGHEPLILDRRCEQKSKYPLFLGDVTDPTAISELCAHSDAVIHLAACLGTQETISNPYPAVFTNIFGSLNVFTSATERSLPVVYIAVGNWFAENSYSISKTTAERFAQMFNLYRGGRINTVRAVNAYGPGQSAAAPFGPSKVRKIMPAFICRALSGMPIEVYGDGSQISDMVYVEDVARQLVWALDQANNGTIYSDAIGAGTDDHTTVLDVAKLVCEITGTDTITHLPMRPGETPGAPVIVDTNLGLESEVGLREGIVRTVSWIKENEGATWKRP